MKTTEEQKYDPKQQFSKKLAGRTEWFWFIYLVLLLVLLAYQPEVGNIVIYLAAFVTIVMITSVLAYTKNSTYEKALNTIKALNLRNVVKGKATEHLSNKEEETEEDGEGNG